MFPISWNFPFRKRDGSLSTISDEMGGELSPATSDTLGGVKIGSGISVTDDGTISAPAYTLPTATSEILGGVKVGSGLSITDGVLAVTASGGKVYYKDFTGAFESDEVIAKFSDGAASASSWHIAHSAYPFIDVSVNGYTPINAIAIDVYTGHYMSAILNKNGNAYRIGAVLGDTTINSSSVNIRVFYVESTNIDVIPS